jgi:hypothetical protein
MNASILNTGLSGGSAQMGAIHFNSQFLQSRLGVKLREQHCPSCHSLIYTRRHGRCGVCERPLPANFLFSCAETQRLEAVLQTERQRHRAWLSKYAGGLR